MSDRDRFHRAARDGYLEVLRESTRKDCNAPDEDGMTPTLWAAYYGNLEALRLLVGRGGDPDKCDHYGNTALHCASAHGHMNCVSFLVNFGSNLWAVDNDFHTAKDVAALNQKDEVLKYLDGVTAKQNTLNHKVVLKMQDRANKEADKRVKNLNKIQKKATKKAEKDEKILERQRKRMSSTTADDSILPNIRKDSRQLYAPPKFSDIVSGGPQAPATTRIKGLGAVSKKVQQKKEGSDFKVRDVESDGKKSVRSLSGLRRDSEVMYVPKYDSSSQDQPNPQHPRPHMKDVFDSNSHISRATSEPDFMHSGTTDSGLGEELTLSEPPSIFERPGFGSVAFRTNISSTLMSLPSLSDDISSGPFKVPARRNGSLDDSIGSASSLQQRSNMQHLPWDEDLLDEDDDGAEASPLMLFCAAHDLADHVPIFIREEIDLEALMLLNDEDLKELGLPLGPRKKLLKAIEHRNEAMRDPGEVGDSRL